MNSDQGVLPLNLSPDYQAVFEASLSLDLLLCRNLNIVAASRAYLQAMRMQPEALIGQPIFDLFSTEASANTASATRSLRASLARVLATGTPDTLVAQRYAMRRPQSQGGGFEERLLAIQNLPVRDASGAMDFILHRAEEIQGCTPPQSDAAPGPISDLPAFIGAKQSEIRRLAAIVEVTPDFVAIAGVDGQLVYMNQAGRRMLGISADADVSAYSPAALCPNWVYERTQKEWLPIAQREGAVSGDGALRTLSGDEIPVSFVMLIHRTASGEPEFISIVARDMTERKRSEVALKRREAEFRALAENIPALVARFDRQLRHLYINRQVAAATGQRAADYIGKTNRDLGISEELVAPGEERLRYVFATGKTATFDFTYPSASGLRYFQSWFGPEFSQSGAIETAICITRDVTEQKQLENELRQRMEELADADRRKDEFLATLAHELRNPLAPLRNGLALLQLGGRDQALAAKARGMMERQLTHMVRLIDDLLDVSRITQGKLRLRRERIALTSVVQSAVEASRPLIDSLHHELTVSQPDVPIILYADPTRLAQVFVNLLTNAAKYTDPGGHIWLSATHQENEVVVTVRDNGIGIAAEHLPRLFQMFSQVSPALERSQGGLGIGLSLVRGLIELHGGSIAARSDGLSRGSEFTVRLPSGLASEPTAHPPSCPSDER